MTERIAVAVTGKTGLAGPVQSAQPERALGVEGVHIDADTRADAGVARLTRAVAHELLGAPEIPRGGDLEREHVACDGGDRPACRGEHGGVVGVVVGRRRVGRAKRRSREALRGLHGGEGGAVDGAEHAPGVIRLLDGVDDRERRHHSGLPFGDRGDHPLELVDRGEGACRIVHEHGRDAVADDGQPTAHRFLTGGAARHHGEIAGCCARRVTAEARHLVELGSGCDDDHLDRVGKGEHRVEAVLHDRAGSGVAGQTDQRLRARLAEPRATPRGNDDDRDIHRPLGRIGCRGHRAWLGHRARVVGGTD